MSIITPLANDHVELVGPLSSADGDFYFLLDIPNKRESTYIYRTAEAAEADLAAGTVTWEDIS